MDTYPTADQVAVAIVAAAREVAPEGALWRRLALEVDYRGDGAHPFTSRARAYAAKALHEVFDCGAVAIGRMTGFGTPAASISGIEYQLRNGGAKWWNPAALERVIAAVREARGALTVPEAVDVPSFLPSRPVRLAGADGAYVSADRPVPSRRQLDAKAMLAEAVRNTAALPIRD